MRRRAASPPIRFLQEPRRAWQSTFSGERRSQEVLRRWGDIQQLGWPQAFLLCSKSPRENFARVAWLADKFQKTLLTQEKTQLSSLIDHVMPCVSWMPGKFMRMPDFLYLPPKAGSSWRRYLCSAIRTPCIHSRTSESAGPTCLASPTQRAAAADSLSFTAKAYTLASSADASFASRSVGSPSTVHPSPPPRLSFAARGGNARPFLLGRPHM